MQDSIQVNDTASVKLNTILVDSFDVPFNSAIYVVPEYSISYALPKLNSSPDSVDIRSANSSDYINFYMGHELKTADHTAIPIVGGSENWFFPLFILVLAIYTWLRIFYYKYFNQLLKAVINTNLTNQIVRDENILLQRASIVLALTFNIITALFLYLLSIDAEWDLGGIGTGFNRFTFFITIISVVYTSKFLILKIIGWLFDLDREMATYIFNIFIINNVLGLILVPIVAIMAYNPDINVYFLTILSLCLIAFSFLYRIIRGLLSGLSISGFSPIYLFLYLCTLEIAPLLVLIRIVNP